MSKKELTYILGAGASYQSIPIVKTFAARFLEFANYLRECCKTEIGRRTLSVDEREKFSLVADEVEDLYKEFVTHQSFDTYFKKLYHQDDNKAIKLGKKLLNIYFIWEHSFDAMDEQYSKGEFKKESAIDKRYDALIASLIKHIKGITEPFCSINFITWNYDVNLLLSLKNFFQPDSTLLDFIKNYIIKKSVFEWQIDEKIKIINVNGCFFSKDYFSRLYNAGFGDCFKTIRSKINDDFLNNDHNDSDALEIRFAWETNNDVAIFTKKAIENSSHIVVIGYTFPIYNRLLDIQYFNNRIVSGKSLFIQDKVAENISTNIKEAFNISTKHPGVIGLDIYVTNIKEINNCDSFFVPNDIFIE